MNKEKVRLFSVLSAAELVKGFRLEDATQQGIKDLDNLVQEAVRRANQDISQKQGFIFEYLESYKFNQDAILKGEDFRAIVSSSIDGQGTSLADVLIKDIKNDEVLSQAQLKSSKDIYYPMKEFFKDKYYGMDKVTNPEHVDRLIEIYEKRLKTGNIYEDKYKDLVKSVKGELSYKNVSSGGTSYEEVIEVTKKYEKFARNEKIKLITREVGSEVAFAIGITAILTGIIDIAQRRKVDKKTIKEITKVSLKSGSGAIISNLLRKLATGNKTNIIGVISSSMFNTAETAYKVFRGDLTIEEGLVKIGSNTSASISALYFSGLGVAVGGPIGAVIGGIIGYTVISPVFGMLERSLRELKVSREQRKEMERALETIKAYIEASTFYLVANMDYIEKQYKEASSYMNFYKEKGDGKYLDEIYKLFGYNPPSNEEIKRKILNDDVLIIE